MSNVTNYLKGIPKWPQVAVIINDDFHERIPTTKVSSWKDLFEVFNSDFFNIDVDYIYRGQQSFFWRLTPTLGRKDYMEVVPRKVADEQMRLFRLAIRGRGANNDICDEDDDQLWALGQHQGLKTPLLDWTCSPYVALFFAFQDEDFDEKKNKYRSIYVLNKSFLDEQKSEFVKVFEPKKDYHGRLVSQAGIFTISSYDKRFESELTTLLSDTNNDALNVDKDDEAKALSKYVFKILVPNKNRKECLDNLKKMNIHHASLFPDLFGASNYCNVVTDLSSDRINEEKQTQIVAKQSKGQVVLPIPTKVNDDTFVGSSQSDIEVEQLLSNELIQQGWLTEKIKILSNELIGKTRTFMVVDWYKRDLIKAKVRNITRSILRKYGFSNLQMEKLSDKFMENTTKRDREKDDNRRPT